MRVLRVRALMLVTLALAMTLVGIGPVGAQDESTTTTTTTTSTTTTTTTSTTSTVKPPAPKPPAPKPPAPKPPAPKPPAPKPIIDLRGLPVDSGTGRRIVYSVGQQRVWWVEANGLVSHTYLVSGKANTPAVGTYHVFSKSATTTSMNGRARMNHMVRFAWGRTAAIGFHSIPVDGRGRALQSESELGSYRSAGCVRQRNSDASMLYNWAPVGTKVVVVK